MGMFDTVVVHYPLPLPSDLPDNLVSEFRSEQVREGFQTKGLSGALLRYVIHEDGRLGGGFSERDLLDDFTGPLDLFMVLYGNQGRPGSSHGSVGFLNPRNQRHPVHSVSIVLNIVDGRVQSVESATSWPYGR